MNFFVLTKINRVFIYLISIENCLNTNVANLVMVDQLCRQFEALTRCFLANSSQKQQILYILLLFSQGSFLLKKKNII